MHMESLTGAKVRTVGTQFTEVLIQHQFMRFIDESGDYHSMAVLLEPASLVYGKGATLSGHVPGSLAYWLETRGMQEL